MKSIRGVGRDPCPFHKEVLVKWAVQGLYNSSVHSKAKHLLVMVKPQNVWGTIDCPACIEEN